MKSFLWIIKINWKVYGEVLTFWSYLYIEETQTEKNEFIDYNSELFKEKTIQ